MSGAGSAEKLTSSLGALERAIHLGVVTANPERVTTANDAFLNMTGFTRDELEAGVVDWRAITPPEYLARDERALEQIICDGACVPFEKEFVLRDCSRVPILIGGVRLSQEPLEWACWIVNLSAQKQAAAAEQRSQQLKAELDAELRGAHWIYDISSRLLGKTSITEALEEILDAAIGITGADFGNIQLLDAGVLRIVVQRNLSPEFVSFFNEVSERKVSVCSMALQSSARTVVEDVATHLSLQGSEARELLLRTGIRAAQSTPLVGLSGEIYGMLSTHFRKPGCPDDRALRYLDLLAGRAGQVLEKLQYAELERRMEGLKASAALANRLAHEINNPVQGLTNIIALLAADGMIEGEGRGLVELAQEQLGRVSGTIREILAVDFGAPPPRYEGLTKLIDHIRAESGLAAPAEPRNPTR